MEERLKNAAKSKVEKQTSELKVFTCMRKLIMYIFNATEKSPKKFKATFVDRMRNLSLSANGYMVRANVCRTGDDKQKLERKLYQRKAYEDLKELENLAFISLECNCILPRQYEQICIRLNETLKYLIGWGKN